MVPTDTIENNVERAATDVEQGNEQLRQAANYQVRVLLSKSIQSFNNLFQTAIEMLHC